MSESKPFSISKEVVYEAYLKVKANKGAAGVDGESVEGFEKDLKENLYRIGTRMEVVPIVVEFEVVVPGSGLP